MPVFARVMLGGFMMMVFSVEMVTMRHVRVMGRLLVIARLVMLGGFVVVVRGMPTVLGGVPMVIGGDLVIGHIVPPFAS